MSTLWSIFESTLRVSTPLIFAALGGMLSERSGVINIALEGMMLVGAFTAAAIAYYTGSAEWGLLAATGAGMVFATIYAVFVIYLRSNQIVAGTAMNLLAMGLIPFVNKILFDSTGATPNLPLSARFQSVPLWMVLGMTLTLIGVLSFWMNRTRSGIWVRFAGENPEALDTQGISVIRVRTFAVICSGALAAWGGASLSIWLASSFSRNMTAGRGFIALAALIFGKWKPIPAALACLFFGLTEALQIRLQGVILWGTQPVPVQFIQILPYVVTMVVLAGWVGQSRAPKALGLPFDKA